ncbi:hypothetical protein ACF0H5_002312 [Mactra antiquata]
MKLANSKNNARLAKVEGYILAFSKPLMRTPLTIEEIEFDLLVVIVTVARNKGSDNPGYLLQTAIGMQKLLKKDKYFKRKFMFVCNTEVKPKSHADAIRLQEFLPYVQRYGTNNIKVEGIPNTPMINSKLKSNARKKEISDYAFCLQAAKRLKFKYVLMLEDDVIPHENMLEILNYTLSKKIVKKTDHDGRQVTKVKDFTFIKLYYPQLWQGYAFEIIPILELISIGSIGGSMFVLVNWLLTPNTRASQAPPYRVLWWTFLLGMIIFILIAEIVGRVFVMDLRRITPFLFRMRESSACCTQAMLYKKDKIQSICDHILKNNSLNKDLAIYDLTLKTGIPGYQIEPNLFHHTGLQTSLADTYKEPEAYIFDTRIFN